MTVPLKDVQKSTQLSIHPFLISLRTIDASQWLEDSLIIIGIGPHTLKYDLLFLKHGNTHKIRHLLSLQLTQPPMWSSWAANAY